ncbi:MAG: hypothetical protein KQI35_03020 [Bacteroidetes bacterium]|nr:hypothetical protein [Bacteroidota bacterium]
MEVTSAFFIVGSAVVLILLITVLLAILYKPGKKLAVHCDYKPHNTPGDQKYLEIHVKNTGKKQVKMMAPFISFYNIQSSQIFQLDPKKVHCKFPRILKVGDEVSCEAEIGHYKETLEKREFHPHKVKIYVKDTMGMKFNSNSLDYRV